MHYGTIYIIGINSDKCILPCVTSVVKFFSPLLPGGGASGAIQAIVVNVPEPLAFTFTDMLQLKNLL